MTEPRQDFSFAEFIKDGKTIKIPRLQRDYAQGRQDSKTINLLGRFLQSIQEALDTKTPLYLDFIYGIMKPAGSPAESERQTFFPLDGQQRLTLLFLLHWFFCLKNQTCTAWLKNSFDYATRLSTQDFLQALLDDEKRPIFQKILSANPPQTFFDTLPSYTWFPKNWLQDPTIVSMLHVLDRIKQKFSSAPYTLADLEFIRFFVLNLQYGMGDEIYVKMNSRGKMLTDFENLKSHLVEFFRESGVEKSLPKEQTFAWNMDNAWLKTFYLRALGKTLEEKGADMDKQMFHFICFIAEICYMRYRKEYRGWTPHRSNREEEETLRTESPFQEADWQVNLFQEALSHRGKASPLKINFLKWAFQFVTEVVKGNPAFTDPYKNFPFLCGENKKMGLLPLLNQFFQKSFFDNKLLLFAVIFLEGRLQKESLSEQADKTLQPPAAPENAVRVAALRIVRNYIHSFRQRDFSDRRVSFTANLRFGFLYDQLKDITAVLNLAVKNRNDVAAFYRKFAACPANRWAKQDAMLPEQEKAKLIGQLTAQEMDELYAVEDLPLFQGLLYNVLPLFEQQEMRPQLRQILTELFQTEETLYPLLIRTMVAYGFKGIPFRKRQYYYGSINKWHFFLTYNQSDEVKRFLPAFIRAYAQKRTEPHPLEKMLQEKEHAFPCSDWRYYLLKYPDFIPSVKFLGGSKPLSCPDVRYAWFNRNTCPLTETTFVWNSEIYGNHLNPFYVVLGHKLQEKGAQVSIGQGEDSNLAGRLVVNNTQYILTPTAWVTPQQQVLVAWNNETDDMIEKFLSWWDSNPQAHP